MEGLFFVMGVRSDQTELDDCFFSATPDRWLQLESSGCLRVLIGVEIDCFHFVCSPFIGAGMAAASS